MKVPQAGLLCSYEATGIVLSVNWLSHEAPLTLVREAFEPTNETILFLHLVKEQLMALVLRLVTHATSQTCD